MNIIEKRLDALWSVCDKCDYDRGFHIAFEQRDETEVILVCPGCGQQYRVNWVLHLPR